MSRLMPNPPPTVNRSVHYYPPVFAGGTAAGPLAAVIVQVNAEGFSVDLSVYGTKGSEKLGAGLGELVGLADVPFSLAPMAGHWTWPPRT